MIVVGAGPEEWNFRDHSTGLPLGLDRVGEGEGDTRSLKSLPSGFWYEQLWKGQCPSQRQGGSRKQSMDHVQWRQSPGYMMEGKGHRGHVRAWWHISSCCSALLCLESLNVPKGNSDFSPSADGQWSIA